VVLGRVSESFVDLQFESADSNSLMHGLCLAVRDLTTIFGTRFFFVENRKEDWWPILALKGIRKVKPEGSKVDEGNFFPKWFSLSFFCLFPPKNSGLDGVISTAQARENSRPISRGRQMGTTGRDFINASPRGHDDDIFSPPPTSVAWPRLFKPEDFRFFHSFFCLFI
jgi:hypothetical protein